MKNINVFLRNFNLQQKALGIYECFDGDNSKLKTLKLKFLRLFTEAMNHFYNREFEEAALIFSRIVKFNPEDKVTEYFRIQSAKYIVEGVPEDWDGVEKLDKK